MKLRIVLLVSLLGIGSLHAMQREVTLDKKTKEKIDNFVKANDLSEIQRLLGPISNDAHRYALEQALIKNKREIVAWLLDMGVDVNTTYINGNTPLHIAAEYDDIALINLLLKHEANINARNARQKTPEDIALAYHNENVARLLQRAKLDQEARLTVPVTPRPRSSIMPRGLKK